MQDKSTAPPQYPERLYANSDLYKLVEEILQNIKTLQEKYPLDATKKNALHEMSTKLIQHFTDIIALGTVLISYLDNYKEPSTLDSASMLILSAKMYYKEKKFFALKSKIDLNVHPMYQEFFQLLLSILERLPKSFRDLIPFIDPSIIDFTQGQANYEAGVSPYKKIIAEIIESCKKTQNFAVVFQPPTTTNSNDDDPDEGWVTFHPVSAPEPVPTTAIAPGAATNDARIPIGLTIWSNELSEAVKPALLHKSRLEP